ncbi:hypothetical protein SVIOM342S_09211 [Streptomyces violaceorubidus]
MTGPLRERDDAHALLAAEIERARAGTGRLVLLRGATGTGRTAVLETAARHAEDRGLRVLRVRCSPEDTPVPFAMVLHLLGPVPEFTDTAPGGDDRGSAARLWRLLRSYAAEGPVLVAVDDVHLADDSSRRWLTEAARHVDRLPVLLVATERSQYDVEPRPAGLTQALSPSLVRTHTLAPLSDRAAAGLVRDAFPDAPARWVEECVRAARAVRCSCTPCWTTSAARRTPTASRPCRTAAPRCTRVLPGRRLLVAEERRPGDGRRGPLPRGPGAGLARGPAGAPGRASACPPTTRGHRPRTRRTRRHRRRMPPTGRHRRRTVCTGRRHRWAVRPAGVAVGRRVRAGVAVGRCVPAGVAVGRCLPAAVFGGRCVPAGTAVGRCVPGGVAVGRCVPAGVAVGRCLPAAVFGGRCVPAGTAGGRCVPAGTRRRTVCTGRRRRWTACTGRCRRSAPRPRRRRRRAVRTGRCRRRAPGPRRHCRRTVRIRRHRLRMRRTSGSRRSTPRVGILTRHRRRVRVGPGTAPGCRDVWSAGAADTAARRARRGAAGARPLPAPRRVRRTRRRGAVPRVRGPRPVRRTAAGRTRCRLRPYRAARARAAPDDAVGAPPPRPRHRGRPVTRSTCSPRRPGPIPRGSRAGSPP